MRAAIFVSLGLWFTSCGDCRPASSTATSACLVADAGAARAGLPFTVRASDCGASPLAASSCTVAANGAQVTLTLAGTACAGDSHPVCYQTQLDCAVGALDAGEYEFAGQRVVVDATGVSRPDGGSFACP